MIIIWFLSFNLLMWYIMLIDLWILKNPCISQIKPTWSCLICCWALFARILLRIFASMFISDTGLYVASLSGFCIRVMVVSYNEFGSLSSSAIFWKSLSRIGVSSSLFFFNFNFILLFYYFFSCLFFSFFFFLFLNFR